MSFTPVPSNTIRINRSQLFVPGSKPDLFEKASASNADIICLDLEDAVAPQDKEQAKENVIKALNNQIALCDPRGAQASKVFLRL